LLGLHQGKHGFPSRKDEPLLIDALLPQEQENPRQPDFADAEERRLFYVALTRAKHHVYLLADQQSPSTFVRELVSERYPVNIQHPAPKLQTTGIHSPGSAATPCTACKAGVLTARAGPHGNFYSCSNYPYCEHTEKTGKTAASVDKYRQSA